MAGKHLAYEEIFLSNDLPLPTLAKLILVGVLAFMATGKTELATPDEATSCG